MYPVPVVVMGVSGSGKSTVGRHIAAVGGREFIDADDLHPIENRRKMAAGVPLTDDDRLPWLEAVIDALSAGERPVLACSALKRVYRDRLRAGVRDLAFVYLSGDPETIGSRLQGRSHEFMPDSLMSTQFETLEPPVDEPRVLELDVRLPIAELAETANGGIHRGENSIDAEVHR